MDNLSKLNMIGFVTLILRFFPRYDANNYYICGDCADELAHNQLTVDPLSHSPFQR